MKKKEEIKKIDIKKYLTQTEIDQATRIEELEGKILEFELFLNSNMTIAKEDNYYNGQLWEGIVNEYKSQFKLD